MTTQTDTLWVKCKIKKAIFIPLETIWLLQSDEEREMKMYLYPGA